MCVERWLSNAAHQRNPEYTCGCKLSPLPKVFIHPVVVGPQGNGLAQGYVPTPTLEGQSLNQRVMGFRSKLWWSNLSFGLNPDLNSYARVSYAAGRLRVMDHCELYVSGFDLGQGTVVRS